ncbi:hypothetical protein [Acidithiobacillus thiooxidans]|uniref:Uncharacterized protein n=1 Tax=Acidithiobacillus thiooxidans ATCC 19377 TaxID=637390 RepID=A0A543Q1Z6_ACITH|nr:hypothetical protein [Acidithiobacillus thiooxidans]MDX5935493.1 hypothetical protein [Acidithiobacillus thiooxidans]TQN50366.1 hypothetical protein DLNHIDIE_00219 [Acidithiobacillus thiooxidans ATCC 19377]
MIKDMEIKWLIARLEGIGKKLEDLDDEMEAILPLRPELHEAA